MTITTMATNGEALTEPTTAPGTVKSKLSRALAQLATFLEGGHGN